MTNGAAGASLQRRWVGLTEVGGAGRAGTSPLPLGVGGVGPGSASTPFPLAGSYYLTTTYGALEHIKNYDKITVTRQLSVEVQDSIHRWERRRTLNKARASRSSVQVTPGAEGGTPATDGGRGPADLAPDHPYCPPANKPDADWLLWPASPAPRGVHVGGKDTGSRLPACAQPSGGCGVGVEVKGWRLQKYQQASVGKHGRDMGHLSTLP